MVLKSSLMERGSRLSLREKKRKLIIKNCKLEDAGMITAKTVGDESSAPLGVKHHNGFKKGMRDFKQCVEREQIIFNVELKDPNAPADFFINGEPVDLSDGRIEVKDLGDGKRQLIINKAAMPDAGGGRMRGAMRGGYPSGKDFGSDPEDEKT